MPGIELRHCNWLLYAAIAVLVAVYFRPLAWSARALPLYLVGEFPTAIEMAHHERANELIQNGDLDEALAELERAVEIDPYTFRFSLAELLRRRGHHDAALGEYRRVIEFDPLFVPAYLNAEVILRARRREDERLSLIEGGIAHLRSQLALYAPRRDDSVGSEYNRKAFLVHDAIRTGIRALEERRNPRPRRSRQRLR